MMFQQSCWQSLQCPETISFRYFVRPVVAKRSVATHFVTEKGTRNSQPQQALSTISVHGGEQTDSRMRQGVADSLTMPIVQTSTYTFKDTAQLIDYQEGRWQSFEYARYGNPTTRAVEEKIMALEGAEDCLISASGMCTATTAMLSLLPAGGHIITTTDCYKKTRQFMQTMLPKMNISVSIVDPADLDGLQAALQQHGSHQREVLFFTECPTNPLLRVPDVAAISDLCHKEGALVCVDSTFATPINMKPLAFGADLVIHSATKYLAGHNDVLGGAICGSAELVDQVRQAQAMLGGCIDAHASYLLLRGMKTLAVRVKQQNETSLELARRLEAHPKVLRVLYPGLPSHPDYRIAQQQLSPGSGGVISFYINGDLWQTAAFVEACQLPYMSPSLGGVESLIQQVAVMGYWKHGAAARQELGITDNLIRYSTGVEDVEDLWTDLEQALAKVP